MSTHVHQSIHYDRISSPTIILRSASRSHSYPTSSYRESIHTQRYQTDELHEHDRHYRQPQLSKLKGRLVPRPTRCELDSGYEVHYGAYSTQSLSSYGECDPDVLEVSPSRPGFVRSPAVSPGHVTEQSGYFSQPPRSQHSPYNSLRGSVRYVASPEVHERDLAWTGEVHSINKNEEGRYEQHERVDELGYQNADYWAEEERYAASDYNYNTRPSYSYHQAPAAPPSRKVTTPTGTIRVNGAPVVNPTKREPAEQALQSAFYGFDPTPAPQRPPPSDGTGTVYRRGLHRDFQQRRRHSEGDTDDHVHGPAQHECRQCNGEGCVRSLAMKEYLKKMAREGERAGSPETWGPGLRQLVGLDE